MGNEVNIGGSGTLYVGEDKVLRFEVLNVSSVPVDVAGWTFVFDVRKTDDATDPAILSETPTVSGTYNASRSSNTQRAIVTLTDTKMNLFHGRIYRYSLKRTDDGSESILAAGDFIVQKATAP